MELVFISFLLWGLVFFIFVLCQFQVLDGGFCWVIYLELWFCGLSFVVLVQFECVEVVLEECVVFVRFWMVFKCQIELCFWFQSFLWVVGVLCFWLFLCIGFLDELLGCLQVVVGFVQIVLVRKLSFEVLVVSSVIFRFMGLLEFVIWEMFCSICVVLEKIKFWLFCV